jgi:uncharacterized protein (TIGR00645 family)
VRPAIENNQPPLLTKTENIIFFSRWLQAPLYFGLIIGLGAYGFKFMQELFHLVMHTASMKEAEVMLILLSLVDIVMVANLVTMVIIGGYETFVSRLYINDHPDKPDWFSKVDAGMLKVKLAASLVTISSIHLLKTFVNADNVNNDTIMFQLAIHLTFVVSVLALAFSEKIMKPKGTA